MKKLLSAVRESLRTTVIALIPVVIVQIEAQAIDPQLLYITLVIGLLRGVERYLHEMDVRTGLEFKSIQ